MPFQVLDDDRRLRDHVVIARFEHRHLAERVDLLVRGTALGREQIDDDGLEGDVLLVERDQGLLRIGRQRVVVELHAVSPLNLGGQ